MAFSGFGFVVLIDPLRCAVSLLDPVQLVGGVVLCFM